MKKICTALFASLILLALTGPAWANGKQQCKTKDAAHHGHKHHKIDKHKRKVLKEFKKLKKTYGRTIKDARQMFLEYLGSNQTCPDSDVTAIRAEYEQQIAQLNETIASQEQQITGLNATIGSQGQQITGLNATIASQEQQIAGLNATITSQELQIAGLNATIGSQGQQIAGLNATIASQEQQIAGLNATITSQQQQLGEANGTIASLQQQLGEANGTIASLQQQLETQAAAQQQELADMAALKDQQCTGQVETAYNNGMTAGMETCATTEPPADPQITGWSTGNYYPYALDVASNGNTYIVEKNYRSVVGYDSSGSQIAQWTSNTLSIPVDLAVDSQGNIYILDQGASESLQKFDPSGQPLSFLTNSNSIVYPMGLFIDSQDNVYITDMGGAYGGRIMKFDSTGALVATFGEVDDFDLFGDEYTDVAVDEANQNIYIVTHYNHMVAKFAMDGTYLGAWQGNLRNPNSIAIGAQGQVFVADTYNDQIDQYDADGNLIDTITSDQLYRPTRIVVDDTGKLFIAVESYQWVQVY